MAIPASWPDALDRLERQVGEDAEVWLREAVEATFGVQSLHDLPRGLRAVAFQKTCGVVLAVEDDPIPTELVGPDGTFRYVIYRDGSLEPADGVTRRRDRIRRAFARYFAGTVLDGPPWRITPDELDRPTREEYAQGADF